MELRSQSKLYHCKGDEFSLSYLPFSFLDLAFWSLSLYLLLFLLFLLLLLLLLPISCCLYSLNASLLSENRNQVIINIYINIVRKTHYIWKKCLNTIFRQYPHGKTGSGVRKVWANGDSCTWAVFVSSVNFASDQIIFEHTHSVTQENEELPINKQSFIFRYSHGACELEERKERIRCRLGLSSWVPILADHQSPCQLVKHRFPGVNSRVVIQNTLHCGLEICV